MKSSSGPFMNEKMELLACVENFEMDFYAWHKNNVL